MKLLDNVVPDKNISKKWNKRLRMHGFISELVSDGKIKYVGLSEASPEVIKRAHKVVPISAVQQEWSLIARDLEEKGGIVDTCRELGIGIVPYRYM